jgi:hypothetical protein
LGLPPSLDYDLDLPTIKVFLRRQTVPLVFSLKVEIQLIAVRYSQWLSQASVNGTTTSVIRLLDTDLDAVKLGATLDAEQSRSIELAVSNVKLHLYTLVIISDTSQQSPDRQVLLRKGLDVALRIIHLSTWEVCTKTPQGPGHSTLIRRQRCLPKNSYRSLAFAAIFLLEFSQEVTYQTVSEKQHVTNHIKTSQAFFRACSLEPLDEYARTAKLIEVLEKDIADNTEMRPSRLTHRMGFSIVLDAIKRGSEVRGKVVTLQDDGNIDEGSHSPRDDVVWEANPLHNPTDASIPSFQADWSSDFSWGFWGDPFLGTSIPYQNGSGANEQ